MTRVVDQHVRYCDIIIRAVRSVDIGVVDVAENKSSERLKIHVVPVVQYMRKGTEHLQKMQEEFKAEIEGIKITTQLGWLVNPRTTWERRQNGEIAAS